MPLPTGTNCITKAEDALRQLLANNSHFQNFCSAVDVVGALARIYTYEVPLPADTERDDFDPTQWLALYPCAVIRMPPSNEWFSFSQTARDQYNSFEFAISFIISFECVLEPDLDEQDQIRTFMNIAGNILQSITIPTVDEPIQYHFVALEAVELTKFAFHKRQDLGDIISLAVKVTREAYPLEELPSVLEGWAAHDEDQMVTHADDLIQFQV